MGGDGASERVPEAGQLWRPGRGLSIEAFAQLVGGAVLQESSATIERVVTSSQEAEAGTVFLALRGESFDGHDFAAAAVESGCACLCVSRALDRGAFPGVAIVQVTDTRDALLELASARRRALDAEVIGITGTCGKTTTKELLKLLIEGELDVVAPEASFNNEIGVPHTVFSASERTEVLILELGTNAPGEIARLSKVARPEIALITMIGRGHLEGLESLEGVFEEKAALLDELSADGTAILGADDRHYQRLAERAAPHRVISFGIRKEADLMARDLRSTVSGVDFTLHVKGGDGNESTYPVSLPAPGLHNVRNLLSAFAVVKAMGLPLELVTQRSRQFRNAPRRLEEKRLGSSVRILDDSYNANPESLLAATSVIDSASGFGRRILILGDMLELGTSARALHREIGQQLAGRFEIFFAIGELAAAAAEGFLEASRSSLSLSREAGPGISIGAEVPRSKAVVFRDVEDAFDTIQSLLMPGDLVLCKGSRRSAIDKLVDRLQAADPEDAEHLLASVNGEAREDARVLSSLPLRS